MIGENLVRNHERVCRESTVRLTLSGAYDRLAYMYSRTDRAEELTETASFPKP